MFIKNDKKENKRLVKRALYDFLVIVISVGVLYFAAAVYAGSIAPPGAVAPTMTSLGDIYHALGGSYDSTAATPKENGNMMEILKCITTKMNGGSC